MLVVGNGSQESQSVCSCWWFTTAKEHRQNPQREEVLRGVSSACFQNLLPLASPGCTEACSHLPHVGHWIWLLFLGAGHVGSLGLAVPGCRLPKERRCVAQTTLHELWGNCPSGRLYIGVANCVSGKFRDSGQGPV